MLSSMPCDGEALSKRIGYADVAFALRQTVRTDLEANRQLATLAELIIRCSLVSLQAGKAKARLGRAPVHKPLAKDPPSVRKRVSGLGSGGGI